MITKARREWFGGIVYSEHPGLTAFVDRRQADRLGIATVGNLPQGYFSAPLDVHLSITDRCNLRCAGCYARRGAGAEGDMTLALARRILDRLAAMGVFTVALGGGEPLLHPDVFNIAEYARAQAIVPNVTTNGLGMDHATAVRCRVFGNVHLSCHHASELERLAVAVRHLRGAGIVPGLNVLVSAETNDSLPEIVKWSRRNRISHVLFLKFKLMENNQACRSMALSPEQERRLFPTIRRLSRRYGVVAMIDCSLFGALAVHRPRKRFLEFFDVNGCQGANAYLAITTDGMVKACSFCESPLGGIELLDRAAWTACREADAFRRMRQSEACDACEYLDLCNGGCRIGNSARCLRESPG